MQSKISEFLLPDDRSNKVDLKNEIENIKWNIIKASVDSESKANAFEQLKNKRVQPFFLWKLEFADIFKKNGGFDIVIGNPPYISEFEDKEVFKGLHDSIYYQGKMNLWYMFACHSIKFLIKKSGILSFIATNNWVTNQGASILRNHVIEETNFLKLIDFGSCMVFKSASVQTMIMLLKKDKNKNPYQFDYRKIQKPKAEFIDALDLLYYKESKGSIFINPSFDPKKFKDKYLIFNQPKHESLLKKLNQKSNFEFDAKNEIAQGIVCPQDSLNIKSKNILIDVIGTKKNIGDGVFVLSQEEVTSLNLYKHEYDLLKPYYTSNELDRFYRSKESKSWVIYTDSSFNNTKSLDNYPNLKKHLDSFGPIITSENKPYGLSRSRVESFFTGEKITSLRKTQRPHFTFTDFDCYVAQSFNVIKTKRVSMKYLIGLLNSKIIFFWLKNNGKLQGANLQIDKAPLLSLPICLPKNFTPFLTIIDHIIESKKLGDNFSEDECELDKLFYKLYELDSHDIQLIEQDIANK